jgi:hypothetical protein
MNPVMDALMLRENRSQTASKLLSTHSKQAARFFTGKDSYATYERDMLQQLNAAVPVARNLNPTSAGLQVSDLVNKNPVTRFQYRERFGEFTRSVRYIEPNEDTRGFSAVVLKKLATGKYMSEYNVDQRMRSFMEDWNKKTEFDKRYNKKEKETTMQ